MSDSATTPLEHLHEFSFASYLQHLFDVSHSVHAVKLTLTSILLLS